MKNRYHFLLGLVIISNLVVAQVNSLKIDQHEAVNPWSNLDLNNSDDQFQFIVVTDRTGGHRPGVFEEAVHKINLLQPEFVMSVGDLIEGYTEDTTILNAEWQEFTGFINNLEMPFFYVPGNHDLTNAVQEKEYVKRFGKTYYHFVYKDVLFLCLNSEDQLRGAGRGTISEPQFKYIEETLRNNQQVKHTFLFLHQPLWIQDDPKFWPQVETLLENREHTVFAGHYHHYVKRERNNGNYIMLATTGGGSQLRGRDFGEFDHVVWVTMTAAGPVVANLWLKGIWDENVATEQSETFIQDLFKSNLVEIEPHFTDDFSTTGAFKIKLSNGLDVPLHIRVQEGFGWDAWVTVDSHQINLLPNSVQLINGQFHPRKNDLKVDQLRSTPIKFIVSAQISEGTSLEIPVQVNLKPLSRKMVPLAANRVTVDGKLDEWGHWPHQFMTDSDARLDYNLTYNDTHLFIAAQVEDDKLVIDTTRSITRQDNLGLSLSFQPMIKSAQSPVKSYILKTTIAKGNLPARIQSPQNIPQDWEYVCKSTPKGYAFELAIPIKYLNEAQGGHWQSLRLNWTIDDLDDPVDWQKIKRFSYFPAWGSDAEILGSGMFFKGAR